MYKIIYRNTETNTKMVEYGFAGYCGKRLYFLYNEKNNNSELLYEIEWFLKLNFSWKIFIKCLTNKSNVL